MRGALLQVLREIFGSTHFLGSPWLTVPSLEIPSLNSLSWITPVAGNNTPKHHCSRLLDQSFQQERANGKCETPSLGLHREDV